MSLNKKQLEIVAILEHRVNLCREFMNDWLLFNQILSAYPSPGVNKAQLENQFLKIKSKLAREHRVLKDTLMDDYQLDNNTMSIVSGATNLESIYSQSEVAVKKLQTEWHRAFISINETLGALEDKKARSEAGQKVLVSTGEVNVGRSGGPDSGTIITIVVILAIIGALVGAFMFIPGLKEMYTSSLGM